MRPNNLAFIEKLLNHHKDDNEILSFMEKIGPTVMGVKPASLVNTSRRMLDFCRRWFGEGSGLACEAVKYGTGQAQLFVYHRTCLTKTLAEPETVRTLLRMGYPADGQADEWVAQLIGRVSGNSYPHEIGLFLGYPLKDVRGFMGALIPYRKTMGWRMYGDLKTSERIYHAFKGARSEIRHMMRQACCDNV